MASSLDAKILQTMHNLLDNFFASLQGDNTSLTSFLHSWSAFDATLRSHHTKLQQGTLITIHNSASIINTVASDIIELETLTEKLSRDNMADITKILQEELGNLSISGQSEVEQPTPSTIPQPPYIRPSYHWILANLHNPYPSKEVKKNISLRYKCSIKDIDAWFIDARRRMGWNRLRKKRFSNKQDDLLAAAKSVLYPEIDSLAKESDTYSAPDDDMHADFALIVANAESLYPDLFYEFKQANLKSKPLCFGAKVKGNLEADWVSKDVGRTAYPTPQPSPARSLEQSPPSSPVIIQDTLPDRPPKRRRCSSSTQHEIEDSRAEKRCRTIEPQLKENNYVTALPSPANTVDDDVEDSSPAELAIFTSIERPPPPFTTTKRKRDLSDLSEGQEPKKRFATVINNHSHKSHSTIILDTPDVMSGSATNPPILSVPSSNQSKRKRRLSEGEADKRLRRPHNALCVPRLQAVSDPLPVADAPANENEYCISDAMPWHIDLQVSTPFDEDTVRVHTHQYELASLHSNFFSSETSVSSPEFNLQEVTFDLPYDFPGANLSGDPSNIPTDFFDIAPSVRHHEIQDYALSQYSSTGFAPFNNTYDVEVAPYSILQSDVLDFNANQNIYPMDAEQEAKRAHVQRLREEIRRLEGELSGP